MNLFKTSLKTARRFAQGRFASQFSSNNAFQLLKLPESLALRCANALLKKKWLENIQSAKKQVESDKSQLENDNDEYEKSDQDINAALVEAVLNLFKAELKIYSAQLSKFVNTAKSTKLNKKDVYNNVCFLEKNLVVIERLYFNRTSVHYKHFAKLNEKLVKFKKDNF